jgi:hypothetical protein
MSEVKVSLVKAATWCRIQDRRHARRTDKVPPVTRWK